MLLSVLDLVRCISGSRTVRKELLEWYANKNALWYFTLTYYSILRKCLGPLSETKKQEATPDELSCRDGNRSSLLPAKNPHEAKLNDIRVKE